MRRGKLLGAHSALRAHNHVGGVPTGCEPVDACCPLSGACNAGTTWMPSPQRENTGQLSRGRLSPGRACLVVMRAIQIQCESPTVGHLRLEVVGLAPTREPSRQSIQPSTRVFGSIPADLSERDCVLRRARQQGSKRAFAGRDLCDGRRSDGVPTGAPSSSPVEPIATAGPGRDEVL